DLIVTGVQTCALLICGSHTLRNNPPPRQRRTTATATKQAILIEPQANGEIVFPPRLAKVSGNLAREEIGGNEVLNFHSAGDEARSEERRVGKECKYRE